MFRYGSTALFLLKQYTDPDAAALHCSYYCTSTLFLLQHCTVPTAALRCSCCSIRMFILQQYIYCSCCSNCSSCICAGYTVPTSAVYPVFYLCNICVLNLHDGVDSAAAASAARHTPHQPPSRSLHNHAGYNLLKHFNLLYCKSDVNRRTVRHAVWFWHKNNWIIFNFV